MKKNQAVEKGKQPYQKPRLRTIELVAEEVLAPGCKIVGTGIINIGQIQCGIGIGCNLDGS